MPEYDVTLTFTFEANDQADADELVGGLMAHIVDKTDCGSVGGKMTEAAPSSHEGIQES